MKRAQADDVPNVAERRELLLAVAREPDAVEERQLAPVSQDRHVARESDRSKRELKRPRDDKQVGQDLDQRAVG